MKIRVLYFATFRDYAGVKEEQFEIPEGTQVGELKRHLAQRHAALEAGMNSAIFAVNREFAFPDETLSEGDEVAVFPPVSGGSTASPTYLKITKDPLDLNAVLHDVVLPSTGATCVFTGTVRQFTAQKVSLETDHLEYEAYHPMAESKMDQIASEIRARWPAIEGIAIVQRVGRLEPGAPSVLIACSAAHRDSGVFEAARFGIDRLKEIVPIWKKEVGPDGDQWVEGEYHPNKDDRN
jgi:molybdopterin synthase catalytic subunit